MSKVIAITGASGFIGSTLTKYFSEKGYTVHALVRNTAIETKGTITCLPYDLNKEFSSECLTDTDYLIHCAYVRNEQLPDAQAVNISGTKKLLDAAREKKVKKIIFLSSMSARPDAITNYGKQKYALQQLFDRTNEVVIRPGLVTGDGGVYKEMESFISNNKFVPLIDGGSQPIQTIHVQELAKGIEKVALSDLSGIYTLASEDAITIKQLYDHICRKLNKKATYISVPYFIVRAGIVMLNAIGLKKLPVSTDSLLGIKNLKAEETKNDLKKIGLSLEKIEISTAL